MPGQSLPLDAYLVVDNCMLAAWSDYYCEHYARGHPPVVVLPAMRDWFAQQLDTLRQFAPDGQVHCSTDVAAEFKPWAGRLGELPNIQLQQSQQFAAYVRSLLHQTEIDPEIVVYLRRLPGAPRSLVGTGRLSDFDLSLIALCTELTGRGRQVYLLSSDMDLLDFVSWVRTRPQPRQRWAKLSFLQGLQWLTYLDLLHRSCRIETRYMQELINFAIQELFSRKDLYATLKGQSILQKVQDLQLGLLEIGGNQESFEGEDRMTDEPPFVDGFLAELKASLAQPDADALFRRINAERMLRLLSDEFIAEQQAERIRILADHRLTGEPGADFLLQIDDYDLRLDFLDAPHGKPVLDPDRLTQVVALLEDNPNTVAVVLVWTTDELPAIYMSVARAHAAAENPAVLTTLLSRAQPLPDVLRAIVRRQSTEWDVDLTNAALCTGGEALDTRRVFEHAIVAAIEAERHRTYRHPARKEAARAFPVDDETKVILDALDQALAGAPAADLVSRLICCTQRRGRR